MLRAPAVRATLLTLTWMAVTWILPRPAGAAPGAREWNQFRGPDRAGAADDAGLLRSWPEEGPAVVWRKALGEGFSGVAASGELVYTMFADEDSDVAVALSFADGSEIWRRRVGEKFHDSWGNGPRSTPTVDGDTVYVLASLGELWALDRHTGEPRWQLDVAGRYPIAGALPRMAQVTPPDARIDPEQFAYSTAPLVVDDLLVVYTGSAGGKGLIALDKATGDVRWTALDHLAGYSSPTLMSLSGRRQIVNVFHDTVAAVDVDGNFLWRVPLGWTITQPLAIPPDKVLVNAAMDAGAMLFRVTPHVRGWNVDVVWKNRLLRHAYSSPVIHGDHVYGFDHATLRCLSLATGEVQWSRRRLGKGTLVLADGLLFILSDRGRLFLAEADPAGFVERGAVQVLEGPSWTPPTIAGGRLFVRDHSELAVLDLVGKSGVGEDGSGEPPAASTAAVSPSDAARALDGDAILAKCAESLGGASRWHEIESLELTGHQSSFSIERPFRVLRQRPDLYRFEHYSSTYPQLLGFDGDTAWRESSIEISGKQTWPVVAHLARARAIVADAEFDGPCLSPPERGYRRILQGPADFVGERSYAFEVTLPDGQVEQWFIDAETFLPIGRVSTVPYAGLAVERRTHFSDYREIGGVKLPYRVEHEFGNHHMVLVVDEAKLDVVIDPRTFELPPPAGMEVLHGLAGRFTVEMESRPEPFLPWRSTRSVSTLHVALHGAVVEQELAIAAAGFPLELRRSFTYDRFRDVYRVAQIDNRTGHMVVLEGVFEDGRLTVSDVPTGTTWTSYRSSHHTRLVIHALSEHGFKLDVETSSDGGLTWIPERRSSYVRVVE